MVFLVNSLPLWSGETGSLRYARNTTNADKRGAVKSCERDIFPPSLSVDGPGWCVCEFPDREHPRTGGIAIVEHTHRALAVRKRAMG